MTARHLIRGLVPALLLSLACVSVSAQYAVSGSAPVQYRWREMKKPFGRIVYPSFMRGAAHMVSAYIDTARMSDSFGLSPVFRSVPVVLYPGNLRSNGLVSWAPKRMELLTSPPTDSYALPWLKQLTVHEYRHVVQMGNLDMGVTRAARFVIGQQAVGIVTAIPPDWFFEGDATAAETDHAMFGRGKQPSFSRGYRALLASGVKIDYDRFKLGSYNRYYPDRYEMGYYMIQSGKRYYGFDVWNKITNYTARHPFYIVTGVLADKKFAENSDRMAERVFTDLRDFWHDASTEDDSSSKIATPTHGFTLYKHPMDIGDGNILAIKSDMGESGRFVVTDLAGREHRLRFVHLMSSRPVASDGRVVWTEYKPSLFWGQKNYSVVRTARIDDHRGRVRLRGVRRLGDVGSLFFPTPMGGGRMAAIEYSADNVPDLLIGDNLLRAARRWRIGSLGTSVTGMAWDDKTSTLAAIILDDSGMWIGRFDIDKGRFEHITPSSYVTVANLTAGGGMLCFSSIASGKEEIHTLDLSSGVERRMTTSRFGSIMATPFADNRMIVTPYDHNGTRLAVQRGDRAAFERITHSSMPSSRLDPYPEDMGLPKLDTISVPEVDATAVSDRRFRRGASLFNVHSWMPLVLDVNRMMSERKFDNIGLGATLVMQDILGASTGSVGYGWDWINRSSLVAGSFSYAGLPVHLTAAVDYGGGKQFAYMSQSEIAALGRKAGNYLEINVSAALPLNFSNGRNYRVLTTTVAYNYNNGLIKSSSGRVSTGVSKVGYSLSWLNYRYMTPKDLAPRVGYSILLSGSSNPFNSEFGNLLSARLRAWVPGVARNHSLELNGQYQYQYVDRFNFRQSGYYPKGCDMPGTPVKIMSAGGSYKLPLVYPDGGIRSFIYFKRIALDIFGQYARGRFLVDGTPLVSNAHSYGAEIIFNYNLLRFSYDIKTGISVYKPSTKNKPMVGVSFGINM